MTFPTKSSDPSFQPFGLRVPLSRHSKSVASVFLPWPQKAPRACKSLTTPRRPQRTKGGCFFLRGNKKCCKSGHCHNKHEAPELFKGVSWKVDIIVLNQLCQFTTPSQSSFLFYVPWDINSASIRGFQGCINDQFCLPIAMFR